MAKESYDYRYCPDCEKVWRYDYINKKGRMLIRSAGNPDVRRRCHECLSSAKKIKGGKK